jgi:hypothetical protein
VHTAQQVEDFRAAVYAAFKNGEITAEAAAEMLMSSLNCTTTD